MSVQCRPLAACRQGPREQYPIGALAVIVPMPARTRACWTGDQLRIFLVIL